MNLPPQSKARCRSGTTLPIGPTARCREFFPGKQLAMAMSSTEFYIYLLFTAQLGLLFGFVVLCFVAGRDVLLKQLMARWPLLQKNISSCDKTEHHKSKQ